MNCRTAFVLWRWEAEPGLAVRAYPRAGRGLPGDYRPEGSQRLHGQGRPLAAVACDA